VDSVWHFPNPDNLLPRQL